VFKYLINRRSAISEIRVLSTRLSFVAALGVLPNIDKISCAVAASAAAASSVEPVNFLANAPMKSP